MDVILLTMSCKSWYALCLCYGCSGGFCVLVIKDKLRNMRQKEGRIWILLKGRNVSMIYTESLLRITYYLRFEGTSGDGLVQPAAQKRLLIAPSSRAFVISKNGYYNLSGQSGQNNPNTLDVNEIFCISVCAHLPLVLSLGTTWIQAWPCIS